MWTVGAMMTVGAGAGRCADVRDQILLRVAGRRGYVLRASPRTPQPRTPHRAPRTRHGESLPPRITPLTDPEPTPSSRRLAWLAAGTEGAPVGSAFLRLFTKEGQEHLAELEIAVHPAERRQGVGSVDYRRPRGVVPRGRRGCAALLRCSCRRVKVPRGGVELPGEFSVGHCERRCWLGEPRRPKSQSGWDHSTQQVTSIRRGVHSARLRTNIRPCP
ncbi:GNAT family N-acetyltransferase [Streptomyces sp. NPDC058251]|uniref:GNAT family N-acetyltransferase n=1 Tax=Streptomyces sp. NPDC058251 TaxID=3346404 RepID=UPI0036E67C2E